MSVKRQPAADLTVQVPSPSRCLVSLVLCICEGQAAAECCPQVPGTECVGQGLGVRLLVGHCGCQEQAAAKLINCHCWCLDLKCCWWAKRVALCKGKLLQNEMRLGDRQEEFGAGLGAPADRVAGLNGQCLPRVWKIVANRRRLVWRRRQARTLSLLHVWCPEFCCCFKPQMDVRKLSDCRHGIQFIMGSQMLLRLQLQPLRAWLLLERDIAGLF